MENQHENLLDKPSIKIELLPRGEFLLILLDEDKKVKGRFSMVAMDRFCISKKLNYLQAIGKITMGLSIGEYAELVLCGLQDIYRKDHNQCPYDIEWVMDKVFDGAGGFGSNELLGLFKHAIGRLASLKEDAANQAENETLSAEEKKSELRNIIKDVMSSTILNSDESATRQAVE